MLDDSFETLMAEFGTAIGLPELKPDEDGVCTLSFDGNITVNLRLDPDTDALVLYSPLGVLGPDGDGAARDALLGANLIFQGTGGCTLGFDPATRLVAIAYREHIGEFRAPALMERVEAFVTVAEAWRGRLERLLARQEGAPEPHRDLGPLPSSLA